MKAGWKLLCPYFVPSRPSDVLPVLLTWLCLGLSKLCNSAAPLLVAKVAVGELCVLSRRLLRPATGIAGCTGQCQCPGRGNAPLFNAVAVSWFRAALAEVAKDASFLGLPTWLWYVLMTMLANFGKILLTEATYYFFMLLRKVAKDEISSECSAATGSADCRRAWVGMIPSTGLLRVPEVVKDASILGLPSWLWYVLLTMLANFGKILLTEATYYFFMLLRKVAKDEISSEC